MKKCIILSIVLLILVAAPTVYASPETTVKLKKPKVVEPIVDSTTTYTETSSVTNGLPSITNVPSSREFRGVVVSDTAWAPFGYYFSEPQLDLLDNHGNAIYLMLNKYAWDSGDRSNVLGLPYRDYIKKVVEIAHRKGIWVGLSLTNDYRDSDFGASEKWNVISNSALRTEWLNWGEDVVEHAKPDAICIMNEPSSPTNDLQTQIDRFHYYWQYFALPSIDAYRAIDSSITVVVPTCPWYRPWWMSRYVDVRSNVVVSLHVYYQESMDWGYEDTTFYSESSENALRSYIDGRLSNTYGIAGSIDPSKVIFDEFGVWKTDSSGNIWINGQEPTPDNWRYAMTDFYEYIDELGFYGNFQYAAGRTYYALLDDDSGYTSFTSYGEVWAYYQP
jgi:hypothetical protein